MAIPGITGYVTPDVFSRVRTIRRSVSLPGGTRIACIIGHGERRETVVSSAEGGGDDGVNPDFTGSNTPDGRHFELSHTSLVENRSSVYLNDVPLSGIEATITSDPFDGRYDYRLEPSTGRLELQRASLVDQGGAYYVPGTANVGNGTLPTLELIDANAPAETWTLRCTSVIRDAYGDPLSGSATFTLTGSVSGQIADSYGAPITFMSDSTARDNTILRIAISEGAVAFDRNDRFTIKVSSKVLAEGDELEVRYIATEDLEDPEFFTDANALYEKHGPPSTTNTLSLGAALAFENGAYGVMALQAKPPVPRRTTETVLESDDPLTDATEGHSGSYTDLDDLRFTIDGGGVPDSDSDVHIFVVDRDDSDTETQVFPTKVAFYDSTITDDPYNNFCISSNYSYSYTVVLQGEVEDEGNDGAVTSGTSTFSAASASFAGANLVATEADTYKQIRIFSRGRYGEDTSAVAGTYEISSVGDGTGDDTKVTLSGVTFSGTYTDLVWELVDPADTSARLLLTKDLVINGTIRVRDGLKISYIDQDDADFFDTNWAAALETLERVDCQMVVPLPDQAISNIQQATVTHCDLMSTTANKKERIAFLGAPTGVTSDAIIGNETVAVEDIGVIEGIQGDDVEEVLADNIEDLANYSVSDNFGTSFRAIYFFPDRIVRSIEGSNTYLSGYYISAAAAGWFAGRTDLTLPLTRKVLVGFSILRDRTYKQVTLNAMGNAGAAVVVPVTGGGMVLHGKTTTNSGAPEEEELSIVFIRDHIATTLRAVLRGFIGKPESPVLAASILSTVRSTLNAFVSQNLITEYKNLSVSRDEVDATQWNVTVEVQPNFPVNYVFVDISVGVS